MSVKRTSRTAATRASLETFEQDLLTRLAEATRDDAKASLGAPGPQPPSKPGETPNRQTDDLYDHIEAHRDGPHETSVTSSRPSGDDTVPKKLEFGTPGGRMKARPFFTPAFERTIHDIKKHVDDSKKASGL